MDAWKYKCSKNYQWDNRRIFDGVLFDISRYGQHSRCISSDKKLTERECVRMAEAYLGQPLTSQYWDDINNDLYIDADTFEEYLAKMGCADKAITRGHALTDARYYEGGEEVYIAGSRIWKINCGS